MIDGTFKPVLSSYKVPRFFFQSTVSRKYRNSFFHRSLFLWNKYIAPKFQLFPIYFDSYSIFFLRAAARRRVRAPLLAAALLWPSFKWTRFVFQSTVSRKYRISFFHRALIELFHLHSLESYIIKLDLFLFYNIGRRSTDLTLKSVLRTHKVTHFVFQSTVSRKYRH